MRKNRNTILYAGVLIAALSIPVYAWACGGGGGGDGDATGSGPSAVLEGGGGASVPTVELMNLVELGGDEARCTETKVGKRDQYCDKIIEIMRRLLSASYQLTTSSITPDPNNIGRMAGIVVRLMDTSRAGGS